MFLKNKTKKQLSLLIVIIFLFGISTFIFKAGQTQAAEYTLLQPLPNIPAKINNENGLGEYLTGMFKLGIGIASVLAVLMIMMGGFKYITSEAISGKGEGKKQVQDALIGLILALAAYLILNTINTDLVNFNINIDPVKPDTREGVETPPPSESEGYVGGVAVKNIYIN